MISVIIQAILGIFVVLILLLIAFVIYNKERLNIIRNAKSIKKKIQYLMEFMIIQCIIILNIILFWKILIHDRDLAPINQAGT